MSETTTDATALIAETTGIVCAYVAKNHVSAPELPALVATVHGALTALATGAAAVPTEAAPERPTAAQIRKSITPDGLISFIDGKPYKVMKHHLSVHSLDAASYRARFGLPPDYPMVAPSYSAHRSDLARALGLGQRGSAAAVQAPAATNTRRSPKQAAA